jgi:hypothetical protein
VLGSPLITLFLLVLGLAAGVLLLATLVPWRSPAGRWALATAIVAVAVLAAHWPGKLRYSGQVLDSQRANAGTYERAARERCLHDMGRPDLVEALAFAREQIPEEARFEVKTNSPSSACLTINLLPREPLRAEDFDPSRDWIVLDRVPPDDASSARNIVHSPSFILVRPEAGS